MDKEERDKKIAQAAKEIWDEYSNMLGLRLLEGLTHDRLEVNGIDASLEEVRNAVESVYEEWLSSIKPA